MFWQMFCPGILVAIAPHLREPRRWRWLVELPARRGALAPRFALFAVAAIVSRTATLGYGVMVYVTIVSLTRPLFALASD